MEKKFDYIELFDKFMEGYRVGSKTAEDVGELIVRLAQFYSTYNLAFAAADIAFNNKAAEIESRIDEGSGKPISSAKAKVLADATEESASKIMAETHIRNLDTILQSAKFLQRSLAHEFSYAGNA